jgi:hypothetical protein
MANDDLNPLNPKVDEAESVNRRSLFARIAQGFATVVIIPLADKVYGYRAARARTPMDQVMKRSNSDGELHAEEDHIDKILNRAGTEGGDGPEKPATLAQNRFARAYNRFSRAYNRFGRAYNRFAR